MSKIHLPRPGTGGFLSDPLPLWCGKPRDLDTHTTSFPHLATCERCSAAQRQYVEDSEYQLMRAKRAAESEREAGVADRVHYSRNATPGITGLARAICGQWSEHVTTDQSAVDCLACLRILKPPAKKARAPEVRRGGAVHYLTAGTLDAGRAQGHCRVWTDKFSTDPTSVTCLRCLTVTRRNALVMAAALAACGPLPPDDDATIGEASTGFVTTGDSEDDTGDDDSSTGYASTSTTSTTSSTTGDTEAPTTGGTTGECIEPACIAAECDDGEACMPDPSTGVLTCVSPCNSIVGLCEAEVCGEPVPGVCVTDPLGLGWCYPS